MTHTTKHTPGPWHKGIGTLEITHKGDQEVIAYVAVRSKGLAGSVEGNMNLIAAAPAMYEALRQALTTIEQTLSITERNKIRDNVLDALAQAEGTHV